MAIKCYDVVESVIEEATKRFIAFKENQESKNILKQYCEVIDKIVEDIAGNSIEVEVDEIKMTISIIIGCDDLVVEPDNKLFYQLSERAISLSFYSDEDDGSMVVEFEFPSIWERSI